MQKLNEEKENCMEIEKLEIVKNGDILSVKIPTNVIINKNY